ncbi:beta-N-acetylhexosaminidase [Chitinophaga sp. Cy-1792]|nr:beta-N-acetylhexosaminidase [Chitinophaga sp. Cy-1792]
MLLLTAANAYAQTQCPVIPKPVAATVAAGTFALNRNIAITPARFTQAAAYLHNELQHIENIPASGQHKAAVKFVQASLKDKNPEAYELTIKPDGIQIRANSELGAFNGAVTLLQLAKHDGAELKTWTINDAPQYAWRGIMLDESRHFFGKEKVKSLIDWMAYYKLNRLHWHLTDEPGWRIAVSQYPKLTTVGGTGNYTNPNAPATYYTKADISEILQYAKARDIIVFPEIDMPGHATAANHAYPEFSGGGSKGHPEFTFNPGKEATYAYLTNILRDINGQFGTNMLHLGGDEVSYGNEKWSTDSSILALMQREHLTTPRQVELYFMQRMADSVYKMNAKLLAWDEMAEVSLPKDKTIIFWWRHDKPNTLQTALDNGYSTVVCPRLPLYFDFVQDSTNKYGRKWSGQYNSIENVYNFSPDKYLAAGANKSLIMGMQANLWTETVSSPERLDYLLFPRICALAEICWTRPAAKNQEDFMERLKPQLALFKAAGLYYYDPFDPKLHAEPVPAKKTVSDYKD